MPAPSRTKTVSVSSFEFQQEQRQFQFQQKRKTNRGFTRMYADLRTIKNNIELCHRERGDTSESKDPSLR